MRSGKYVLAAAVVAAVLLCLAGVLYFFLTPVVNDTPWFDDGIVYHVLRAVRIPVAL